MAQTWEYGIGFYDPEAAANPVCSPSRRCVTGTQEEDQPGALQPAIVPDDRLKSETAVKKYRLTFNFLWELEVLNDLKSGGNHV